MVSSMRPWDGCVCRVPDLIIELARVRQGVVCNLRNSQRQDSPGYNPNDSKEERFRKIERLLNPGHMDLCHENLEQFMRQVKPGTKLAMFVQSFDGETATLVVKIREVVFRGNCSNPVINFPRPKLWQKMFGRTTVMWGSFVLAAAVAPQHISSPRALLDRDGREFVTLFFETKEV